MTPSEQRHHRAGLLLVAAAALSWSSAGIFVRLIGADLFTLLFWRGLFSGATVLLVFIWLERGQVPVIMRSLRWPTIAVALLSALSMVTGIGAIRYGAVADVMVIYATVPFVTAAVAYIFIGEKPSRATLAASVVALVGVGVMLWGAPIGGSMTGQLLAVLMTLGMAGFTTIMRHHREVPMLPAMAASAWICSFISFWWASPASITPADFALCAAFGVFQNGLGLALYTFGSKRVPASEATLLAALEVPLTPLWVFLFLGETPLAPTLVGGGIVLAALVIHIARELRRPSSAAPAGFAAPP